MSPSLTQRTLPCQQVKEGFTGSKLVAPIALIQ